MVNKRVKIDLTNYEYLTGLPFRVVEHWHGLSGKVVEQRTYGTIFDLYEYLINTDKGNVWIKESYLVEYKPLRKVG